MRARDPIADRLVRRRIAGVATRSTSSSGLRLPPGALAVAAARPAAGPTLTLLEFLPRAANAPLTGRRLLRIFDPADELIAGQWSDVLPRVKHYGVRNQRLAQVTGKLVYHPTGHSWTAHGATVAGRAGTRHHWGDPDEAIRVATAPSVCPRVS